jgi:dipeptidase E
VGEVMKAIIPIGGGEISLKSTLKIDEYIVNLLNKETKKVLFIPTASGDMVSYIEKFKAYYESLGCEVDTLLLSQTQNDNLIRSKIFSSDIIYIGGGNTARMMRIFKRNKVNEYLLMAYEKGIILTGLSAGAMAYFTNGYSDSNRSTNPEASLCLVKCLNIIPYCFCPHYNEEERKSFDEFVISKGFNGLALEDDVALVYIDDEIKGVIKANDNNEGYYINNSLKEKINSIE